MQHLLEIENLCINYGARPVLQNIYLTLAPGEILAIVGTSGSGKSTLLCAISGMLAKDGHITEGRIIFQGKDMTHFDERLRGRTIGMIFQNPEAALCPVRTIGAEIYESLRPMGIRARKESDRLAQEAFKALGLPDPARILKSVPAQLSGGMNQRVNIAIAMLQKPKLLLADEPTSALDAISGKQALDALRTLRAECGTAILIVTHNIALCEKLADNMCVLAQGRIAEKGAAARLCAQPRAEATKALLRAAPRLRRDGYDHHA